MKFVGAAILAAVALMSAPVTLAQVSSDDAAYCLAIGAQPGTVNHRECRLLLSQSRSDDPWIAANARVRLVYLQDSIFRELRANEDRRKSAPEDLSEFGTPARESPTRQTPRISPGPEILAGRNENIASPPRAARGESAKVTGNFSCNGNNDVDLWIDIDGDIDASTVEKVIKLFDELHDREAKIRVGTFKCEHVGPPDLSRFSFTRDQINSRGGSVVAAMAIGRMLRKERVSISINNYCVSACVLILAGAVNRDFGPSATIAIHRPYLRTTPQRPMTDEQVKTAYRAMLRDIRAYLREMNVSERLADDMLQTEPDHVRTLTYAELKEYGLKGLDPGEQERLAIAKEAFDVRQANQWGLDRAEYIRRKAIVDSVCTQTTDDTEFEKCRLRVLKTDQR
jgi:Clp protease